MSERPPARIAFLGFGLIGGSIAKALKARSAGDLGDAPSSGSRPYLIAWTPAGRGPAQAVDDGVIDAAAGSVAEALVGTDLVVIAAPPLEAVALVERLGSDPELRLEPGAIVTDVTSTKRAIEAAAARSGLSFVGGHPMAGLETSGYEAAVPGLFVDRPWVIVVPGHMPATAAGPVRWLAAECGARPIEMTAEAHDAAAASISHLPLIAAAALVEAVAGRGEEAWRDAGTLASSGWASATRLALGDPRMGAGIVATNQVELATGLRALRASLDAWLAELDRPGGPDPEALERRLAAARDHLAAARDDLAGAGSDA